MLKIEYLNSSHPKQFWSEIKKIGPRKNTLIPAEIKDDNGLIVSNKVAVLERWKTDFCNLYQSTSGCHEFVIIKLIINFCCLV